MVVIVTETFSHLFIQAKMTTRRRSVLMLQVCYIIQHNIYTNKHNNKQFEAGGRNATHTRSPLSWEAAQRPRSNPPTTATTKQQQQQQRQSRGTNTQQRKISNRSSIDAVVLQQAIEDHPCSYTLWSVVTPRFSVTCARGWRPRGPAHVSRKAEMLR